MLLALIELNEKTVCTLNGIRNGGLGETQRILDSAAD